jgi:hypothetical protein
MNPGLLPGSEKRSPVGGINTECHSERTWHVAGVEPVTCPRVTEAGAEMVCLVTRHWGLTCCLPASSP